MKNSNCPICSSERTNFLTQKYDDRFGQPDLFDFYFCQNCNIAFITNKPSKGSLSCLYKKYYVSESVVEKKSFLLRKILEKLKLDYLILNKLAGNIIIINNISSKFKILEIGSGFNKNIKEIIEKKKINWKGLEVNKDCVNKINQSGLFAYHGTIDDFKVNEKFDIIVLSQALEHQYDINAFFENCRKILNPCGKIIFTTPNFDSIYREKYKKKWINWHAPYHTILLSKKGIENICKKNGFKVIKFYTYTPTSWYLLQKNFKIPKRGEKNDTFNFNFSLTKQLFISIFLGIRKKLKRKDNDCIYCEIKLD